jgi:imidazolonepropionase-like amidohydrolase
VPMREVLHGATIIDGTGATPATGDIVIEGGVILEIGSGLSGDREVDCTGAWIMPGAIDCHVHAMVESFELMRIIETPFSLSFYLAARNLAATLEAGVTTVRDAGGADLGVKRAQELGYISGPTMQISINLLSTTGGHADHWSSCGFAMPDLIAHPGRPDGVVDGADQVLQRTRELMRAGADFIKVCATGGVLSPADHPSDVQFLPDELRLIVEVAASRGKPVAAHAQGAAGIKNAIRAGVRSIEHGTMLDDEAIEEMVARGTFLVPTMTALEWVVANPEGRRPAEIEQALEIIAQQRESVRRAIQAGVRIAVGSDAGVIPHGENLSELGLLVDMGMTPIEAISAATSVGADLLGISETHGVLREAARADLLVLDADPTRSIDRLADGSSIRQVWQGGAEVVRRTAATVNAQFSRA